MGKMQGVLDNIGLDEKEDFSPETLARFQSDADFYRRFLRAVEVDANNNFPVVGRPDGHAH